MSLKILRRQIDRLDKEIINLLNKRANAAIKIAGIKHTTKQSVYCPDREREVLKRLSVINRGPVSPGALEAIYREIMSSSLALEKNVKIAYLGPQATFTHQAALKKFGSQVEYAPCESITDVFREVERGDCDYGVVPIENSVEGAVSHTMDMLVDSDLKICSQVILDISHNLLALCSKERIKRVYSNPMVFGQCRQWLEDNLRGLERIEVSSTTHAADLASREKYSACIASLLASRIYNLKVVARSIEDSPHNITKFLVIGNNDVPATGNDKTSIMFSIKDKVGALHDMLIPFKKYKINLTKIESRPSKKKAWDYYFFVEFSGHKESELVKKALKQLENNCKFLKILGSYPIGE
ncbi:MAG: prephenate dehydratase [Candidatus Omnitrophota bacterium]|nr:prephenate dehydratase [Candidatus Omnitrophota bacterium]MBU1928971.1 prephenate dehydratase [Candidatus Omnitrophota bacterium]MBU2035728.1 prephenate dehydratase [Candidatus Omnitrophota bacterium]MBU2221284.1 prephenate dehydratase [Candidatus Omnitrophota bacterium]MBU2258064.1 prephenate dehydratase [Candidatus Omnitrophota bacterium]